MTYPFLTLDDDTEFVHSEVKEGGRVRVDIERPDARLCFKSATCWLPDYTWEGVSGFSPDEVARLQEVVESCAHLIMEFARTGGGSTMPQVFRIGPYWVYFWLNEGAPPEPAHVHVSEGRPTGDATKVWITRAGKCLVCNNNSCIPDHVPRNICRIVESRSSEVVEKWRARFGEVRHYC